MGTRRSFILELLFAMIAANVCASCRSAVEPPIRNNAPAIRRLHPASGTALIRFQQIDDGVYKGSRPKTDADFVFLRSKGIRYIINLKFFPWLNNIEKRRAQQHGIIMLTGQIGAWTFQPSEKSVNAVLCLLRDKRYQPIYVHCDLGRDRAMLIVGLYQMYYSGKSKEEAWREMKHYGFKDDWTLAGLKNYFEAHSQQPISRFIPACPISNTPKKDCKQASHKGPISVDLDQWFGQALGVSGENPADERRNSCGLETDLDAAEQSK